MTNTWHAEEKKQGGYGVIMRGDETIPSSILGGERYEWVRVDSRWTLQPVGQP